MAVHATTVGNAQRRSFLWVRAGGIECRARVEVRRSYALQNTAIRPGLVVVGILRIRVHDPGGINLVCFHQAVAEIQDQSLKRVWGDIPLPPASLLAANADHQTEIWLHVRIRAVYLRPDARFDGLPKRVESFPVSFAVPRVVEMRRPPIEIVEFGELIYGKIQDSFTLRNQIRIPILLSRVNRGDSQISRQVIVVDVADQMRPVVVEGKSFLEQSSRG